MTTHPNLPVEPYDSEAVDRIQGLIICVELLLDVVCRQPAETMDKHTRGVVDLAKGAVTNAVNTDR